MGEIHEYCRRGFYFLQIELTGELAEEASPVEEVRVEGGPVVEEQLGRG